MTEQEAARIVAYLNAAFPHEAVEPETFAVFTREIARLESAEIAMAAAELTVRQARRLPVLAEFMATYRSQAAAARTLVPALEEPAAGPRELPDEAREYVARLQVGEMVPAEAAVEQLPAGERGKCADCAADGERVLYGVMRRALCRRCATARLRVQYTLDSSSTKSASAESA